MSKRISTLTEGQRAYEAKRAAKAGMSLEKWLGAKEKDAALASKAEQAKTRKDAEATKSKKPGLISRLIDRAHKPL